MLGTTEYVAEACEEQLKILNHQVNLHLNPNFESIFNATFNHKNEENKTWLVCTSTHGAGEYPDNIQGFVNDLKNCEQDLSSINFIVIAIGDSNYDTFCQAGIEINKLLETKGYKTLVKVNMIDMSKDIDPEELAQQWLIQISDLL